MTQTHRVIDSFPMAFKAGVAAMLALSGCSSAPDSKPAPETQTSIPTEPLPGSTSRFPVVHEDWAKLGYRLDWVGFPFPRAASSSNVVSAALYDDIVVLQEKNSAVTVMDASTGQNRWSSELTGPLTKWIGIAREEGDRGRLLVASESEMFVLAPATGTLLGRERFGRVANTPPLLLGNVVITGTTTGVVQSHRLGTGLPGWAFTSRGAIEGSLQMVGGVIGGVSQGGDVFFLTPAGELVGRARVFGRIDNNPATDGQSLFVASRDQSVWAFAPTGAQLWRYRTPNPLTAQPVAHDGVLYCDLGEEGLTAFNASTGEVIWRNPAVHGNVVGVRAGRLIVWHGSTATTIDPARGDIVDRIDMPGVTKIAPDAFVDGNMYAISDRAVVAKFMIR